MLAIVYFSHAFSPPAVPSDPLEAADKSYYNSKVGVYAAVAFYLGAAPCVQELHQAVAGKPPPASILVLQSPVLRSDWIHNRREQRMRTCIAFLSDSQSRGVHGLGQGRFRASRNAGKMLLCRVLLS